MADLKAAYRLFDCPDVTFDGIAGPHWEQTRQQPPGRYLLIDDTTEVEFGIRREISGLGPTGNGGGRGFLLHSALMVSAESEEIFGLAGQKIWYRKTASGAGCVSTIRRVGYGMVACSYASHSPHRNPRSRN